MPVQYQRFVRSVLDERDRPDLARVDAVATVLRSDLDAATSDLSRAHVFGAQSSVIQRLVSSQLVRVGFREEVVLDPHDGFVTRARPDFVFELGDGRGVIAEVERTAP